MKAFLAGLMIGLLVFPLTFLCYVKSGRAPPAALDQPMPFEAFLARGGLHARIVHEAPQKNVSSFTGGDLVTGADVYQKNCAFCHGLPNQPASPASRGMFPRAPQLFAARETVTNDPVGVT